MLDPKHLTDPAPKVASLLAIAAVLHDYGHEYGRLALAGVLPGISDVQADNLIDEIAGHLDTAERLFERETVSTWAEQLRAQHVEHAKDAARTAMVRHALVAA